MLVIFHWRALHHLSSTSVFIEVIIPAHQNTHWTYFIPKMRKIILKVPKYFVIEYSGTSFLDLILEHSREFWSHFEFYFGCFGLCMKYSQNDPLCKPHSTMPLQAWRALSLESICWHFLIDGMNMYDCSAVSIPCNIGMAPPWKMIEVRLCQKLARLHLHIAPYSTGYWVTTKLMLWWW